MKYIKTIVTEKEFLEETLGEIERDGFKALYILTDSDTVAIEIHCLNGGK